MKCLKSQPRCIKRQVLATICMQCSRGCNKSHKTYKVLLFLSGTALKGGHEHMGTLSHHIVVTASSVEYWLETKIRNWRCWWWQKIHRRTYSVCFFIFTYTLTLSQCMWKLRVRPHTSTHMHTSTWNPLLAVSQSNWQCFQGMPCWAICGALIRANKRAYHRKPPGITHGSAKPQDMIDGWIAKPLWGVQRGTGEGEVERSGWRGGGWSTEERVKARL